MLLYARVRGRLGSEEEGVSYLAKQKALKLPRKANTQKFDEEDTHPPTHPPTHLEHTEPPPERDPEHHPRHDAQCLEQVPLRIRPLRIALGREGGFSC